MKRTSKTTSNFEASASDSDLKLTILRSIHNSGKLPEVSLADSTLSYHVKKLKIDGIITKLGYGTWAINHDKLDQSLFLKQLRKVPQVGHPVPRKFEVVSGEKTIRGHGFVWTLRFQNPYAWNKRQEFLEKKGVTVKRIRAGSTVGHSFVFKGCKTWLLDSSIVIYLPEGKDYTAASADEAYRMALYDALAHIKSLESFLGVSLKRGQEYQLKCSRNHYADVGNAYAKMRKGKAIRIADHDGEWLLVDASTGVPELETVKHGVNDAGKPLAATHMDEIVKPFFNQLKETRLMPQDVLQMFAQSNDLLAKSAANQDYYAENMKSHVLAVQALSKGVQDLTRVVRDGQKRSGSGMIPRSKSISVSSGPERQLDLESFGGFSR